MTFGECYRNTVLQLSERYAADEATAMADRLILYYCGLDRVNRVLKAKENIHVTDKKNIENALSIAQAHLPKRRKKILIEDLYQPIGQKVAIEKLETLSSFNKFKISVEEALRKLNYLN